MDSESHEGAHFYVLFISAAVIVGGIDSMSQSLALAKKPHIVIGESMSQ